MLETSRYYFPFQPTLTQLGLEQLALSLNQTKPSHSLRSVVHSYLQIQPKADTIYPMLPDGTHAVFISRVGSQLGGVLTQSNDFKLLKGQEYFGIHFYPAALRHCFQLNLAEITNDFADDHFLPSRHFKTLHEYIYQHRDFADRVRVCEAWLLKHFTPRVVGPFDYALELIYQSLGNMKVDQLAKLIGWSSRHLNRQFLLHTGINTKTFLRIVRMQSVFKEFQTKGVHSIDKALDAGYCDQAHFLKELRQRILPMHRPFFNRFRSDFYNT